MPKAPTERTLFIERMKREGGTPTPPAPPGKEIALGRGPNIEFPCTPFQSSEFRVQSSEFRVQSSEFREAELQRSRMTTELIQLTNQTKTAVVAAISADPIAESGTSETRDVVPRPTP